MVLKLRASQWAECERVVMSGLAALTARNSEREHIRLLETLRAGRLASPALEYSGEPPKLRELAAWLAHSAHKIRAGGDPATAPAWGELLEARARELQLEAELAAAAGTAHFAALAALRFSTTRVLADEADVLARRWRAFRPRAARSSVLLKTAIELELRRAGVGFAVLERDAQLALAATGFDVIVVRRGARASARVARAIAAHEVYGHARPRLRARQETGVCGLLLRIGTAGGVDGQEGFALCEEAAYAGEPRARCFVLGARHLAAQAMVDGATWHEVVGLLTHEVGVRDEDALRIAMRVFRGSQGGRTRGAGRERQYLPALLATRRLQSEHPDAFRWLARGQVAPDVACTLHCLDETVAERS
jgi:hypothetical protein